MMSLMEDAVRQLRLPGRAPHTFCLQNGWAGHEETCEEYRLTDAPCPHHALEAPFTSRPQSQFLDPPLRQLVSSDVAHLGRQDRLFGFSAPPSRLHCSVQLVVAATDWGSLTKCGIVEMSVDNSPLEVEGLQVVV